MSIMTVINKKLYNLEGQIYPMDKKLHIKINIYMLKAYQFQRNKTIFIKSHQFYKKNLKRIYME